MVEVVYREIFKGNRHPPHTPPPVSYNGQPSNVQTLAVGIGSEASQAESYEIL